MKHSCYIFFLTFLSIGLHAQLQTAHWYFGNKVGLDFSSGNPVVDTNGKTETNEGCTSISDEFGNLMFYTDGQKVYNKTHSIMQNGNGLLGHSSSTSSAIVLPKPDDCNLYYLFTIDARERREKGINYNVIDMRANGGLGAVTEKNIKVPINGIQQGYEKLAAISNTDNSGYWIVTHFEGNFYAFAVTGEGIDMNPVVSPSGIFGGEKYIGYLKASSNGSKLGMAMFSSTLNTGYLSVYDFNTATGVVSNENILYQPSGTPGNYYGIEFSPNGNLLYATNIIIGATVKVYIEQYNLTAPSIAGSKYIVSLNAHYGALQLALDGKIYNSGFEDEYIGAITNPDMAYNPGTGAYPAYNRKYIDLRPYLGQMTPKWGLPTFLNNYFRIAPLNINGLPISENQQYCIESILDFNYCYQGGQIQSIHWDFGDGNTSDDFYPKHTYINPGNYTITLTITAYGNTYIRTYPITITPKTKPTFAGLNTLYCQNALPQTLPATSDNGVTGTWNPSTIDTSTTGTKTYTFTPDAGQCGTTYSISIEIKNQLMPTFTLQNQYCLNSTAQTLPTTSENGIVGTWNPSVIDTSAVGTKTYTFTPNAGQCGTTYSIPIEITNQLTPIFTIQDQYCLNATSQNLSTISDNGISGTWNPSAIDTSAIGTKTYTFTPNAGQCATAFPISIEIKDQVTPAFNLQNEYCLNAAPQTLPTTSDNGIVGTWNPSAIHTSAVGTKTYTFTPNAGQCGTTYSISIEITNQLTPTFTLQNQYCLNSTPQTLPTTSNNSILGTWSPSAIDTSAVGTKTYTFTPNADQCSSTFSFVVTVTAKTTPIFNLNNSYCIGSTPQLLPSVSSNGITGSWSPSVINTSVVGAATYTFTPDSGQCADSYTLAVSITDKITPVFNLEKSYCLGSIPQILPLTSDNGISGTWNPSVIDTSIAGIKNYTFTPNSGQCGTSYTLSVMVNQNIVLSTNIPENVLFCEDGSMLIDAGNDYPNNYYTWTWGNGNTFTGPKIIIKENGVYTLTVSNGSGCTSSFTIKASYYGKPIIKGVSVDGNKITITAEGENLEYSLDTINWQTSNVFDNLQQGGLYTIYIRSNGCLPISIKVPIYKVTNFFSPNGDGYNDTWKLYPEGVLEASHIIIVDRYGSKVYEKTSNTGFEWNGTNGGRPLPTDTYWYVLEIPATKYLPAVKYSGFILLKNRN